MMQCWWRLVVGELVLMYIYTPVDGCDGAISKKLTSMCVESCYPNRGVGAVVWMLAMIAFLTSAGIAMTWGNIGTIPPFLAPFWRSGAVPPATVPPCVLAPI